MFHGWHSQDLLFTLCNSRDSNPLWYSCTFNKEPLLGTLFRLSYHDCSNFQTWSKSTKSNDPLSIQFVFEASRSKLKMQKYSWQPKFIWCERKNIWNDFSRWRLEMKKVDFSVVSALFHCGPTHRSKTSLYCHRNNDAYWWFELLESVPLPTMSYVAAATVAQSVKRPGLRSRKRGATELTWVWLPVMAQSIGKILATPSMRQT